MSFASALLTAVWVWSLVPIAKGLSVEEVSRAFKLDTIIVDHLKNFLQQVYEEGNLLTKNDTQFEHVRRYVDEHQKLLANLENSADNSTKIAADGLAALVLTRRLAKDWPRLLRLTHNTKNASISTLWNSVKSRVAEAEQDLAILLEEEDLTMQSTNFAKLIAMYNMKPEEVTSHRPFSYQSSVTLQIKDAMVIGASALSERLYGTAADIFVAAQQQLAEHKSSEDSTLTSEKRLILERQLKHLVHLATSLVSATEQKLEAQGKEAEETLRESLDSKQSVPENHHAIKEDAIRFGKICRGHSFLSQAEKSQLRCRLDTRGSPYLILMPALVEENSLNPEVLTFYQVLTDYQIERITSMAKPFLDQATFFDSKDDLSSYKIRSSYTAWLREDTDPMLQLVNKRISALTGLDLLESRGASEPLQVNLYGAGGHYSPHLDSFNLYEKLPNTTLSEDDNYFNGDRIATFMFYMNDVEAGGYTAFPRIGVGVQPTIGSAVFWKNLLPDGSEDTRLLHGACPVLKGIKWVSNKWIRHNPQFQRRPCPLTRSA